MFLSLVFLIQYFLHSLSLSIASFSPFLHIVWQALCYFPSPAPRTVSTSNSAFVFTSMDQKNFFKLRKQTNKHLRYFFSLVKLLKCQISALKNKTKQNLASTQFNCIYTAPNKSIVSSNFIL